MKPIAALVTLVLLWVRLADGMTFGVIGDWGMGGFPVGWFHEVRASLQFNEQCEFLKCNFTISCGDNLYCGNVYECLHNSFELGLPQGGPFFPSIGNHDNVGPQLEYTKRNPRWRFLGGFYTVKLPIDETGYTVQLFSVNTNDGSLAGGGQYAWLESELRKSDARWKIIFGHHPTTSSGRHRRVGSPGRIHDLMVRYNAQVFFVGHDHLVEMSNFGGRVLGLSGGMARGGMMNRGIGGHFRKFTLTSPGEWNQWRQDWPTHGFITGDLSPNALSLQIWESSGGMVYECTSTWDWLSRVSKEAASRQHEFPAPESVLVSLREEVKLPLGPGGGIAIYPDFSSHLSSIQPRQRNLSETTSAPTAAPPATFAPPLTPSPPATLPPVPITEKPEPIKAVPSFYKYAVASECLECQNRPTSGVPFTVFISGGAVSSLCRIYLSSSAVGCDVNEKPSVLAGTTVLQPQTNTVVFTVSGPSTQAFVCFSIDKGQTYSRLLRADTVFETPDFVVFPAPSTAAPAADRRAGELSVQAPIHEMPRDPPRVSPAPNGKEHVGPIPAVTGLVAVISIVAATVGVAYVFSTWRL